MQVDVFGGQSPGRFICLHAGGQSLVVVVDGSGSWGNGTEAATFTRAHLQELWGRASGWSVQALSSTIREAISLVPESVRSDEVGWSFSITALLCSGGNVECLAAGAYAVHVVRPGGDPISLYRPQMLADKLEGDVPADSPYRQICVGPFVGSDDELALSSARHELRDHEVVVVAHLLRLDVTAAVSLGSARAFAASSPRQDVGPVALVRP